MKAWLLALSAVATAVGIYLKWRYSPKRETKLDAKDRQKGLDANAAKDGKALGRWFRNRSKRNR